MNDRMNATSAGSVYTTIARNSSTKSGRHVVDSIV